LFFVREAVLSPRRERAVAGRRGRRESEKRRRVDFFFFVCSTVCGGEKVFNAAA
jgi:hypothetical protein